MRTGPCRNDSFLRVSRGHSSRPKSLLRWPVRHVHVNAALLQLGKHLLEPFLLRFFAFRFLYPAYVVIALIRRPLIECHRQAARFERLLDEAGHRMSLAPGHSDFVSARPANVGAQCRSSLVACAALADNRRMHAFAQPGSERVLVELAGGEAHEDRVQLRVVGGELPSVEIQEQFTCDHRSPLVAVDKRMIAGDAEGVRGAQCREIEVGPTIGMNMFRAGKRRLQQSLVAHTSEPAVLGNLPGMLQAHLRARKMMELFERVKHPVALREDPVIALEQLGLARQGAIEPLLLSRDLMKPEIKSFIPSSAKLLSTMMTFACRRSTLLSKFALILSIIWLIVVPVSLTIIVCICPLAAFGICKNSLYSSCSLLIPKTTGIILWLISLLSQQPVRLKREAINIQKNNFLSIMFFPSL
jgi:hypothetical protein